jgi:hypothetical protein
MKANCMGLDEVRKPCHLDKFLHSTNSKREETVNYATGVAIKAQTFSHSGLASHLY